MKAAVVLLAEFWREERQTSARAHLNPRTAEESVGYLEPYPARLVRLRQQGSSEREIAAIVGRKPTEVRAMLAPALRQVLGWMSGNQVVPEAATRLAQLRRVEEQTPGLFRFAEDSLLPADYLVFETYWRARPGRPIAFGDLGELRRAVVERVLEAAGGEISDRGRELAVVRGAQRTMPRRLRRYQYQLRGARRGCLADYLDDRPIAETAAELGIGEQQVGDLVAEALATLVGWLSLEPVDEFDRLLGIVAEAQDLRPAEFDSATAELDPDGGVRRMLSDETGRPADNDPAMAALRLLAERLDTVPAATDGVAATLIGFDRMHPDLARDFADAMDSVLGEREDRDVVGECRVEDLGDDDGDGPFLRVRAVAGERGRWHIQAILLNERFAVDPELLQRRMNELVARGVYPPEAMRNPIRYLVLHELGHVLNLLGGRRASDQAPEELPIAFIRDRRYRRIDVDSEDDEEVDYFDELTTWMGLGMPRHSLTEHGDFEHDGAGDLAEEAVADAFAGIRHPADPTAGPGVSFGSDELLHARVTDVSAPIDTRLAHYQFLPPDGPPARTALRRDATGTRWRIAPADGWDDDRDDFARRTAELSATSPEDLAAAILDRLGAGAIGRRIPDRADWTRPPPAEPGAIIELDAAATPGGDRDRPSASEVVARSELFRDLSPSDATELIGQMRRAVFSPGQELDLTDRVYIVVSGRVRTGLRLLGGRTALMAIAGPSDTIGWLEAPTPEGWRPGVRTFASAMGQVEAWWVDHQIFETWLTRLDIATNIRRMAFALPRFPGEEYTEPDYAAENARVAGVLLDLARFGIRRDGGLVLELRTRTEEPAESASELFTVSDLAQLADCSSESAHRALAEFTDRDWIRADGDLLSLLDRERLAEHAGRPVPARLVEPLLEANIDVTEGPDIDAPPAQVAALVAALQQLRSVDWIGPGTAVRFTRLPGARGSGFSVLLIERDDGRRAVASIVIDLGVVARRVGSTVDPAKLYEYLVRAVAEAMVQANIQVNLAAGGLLGTMEEVFAEHQAAGRVDTTMTFDAWLRQLRSDAMSKGLRWRSNTVLVDAVVRVHLDRPADPAAPEYALDRLARRHQGLGGPYGLSPDWTPAGPAARYSPADVQLEAELESLRVVHRERVSVWREMLRLARQLRIRYDPQANPDNPELLIEAIDSGLIDVAATAARQIHRLGAVLTELNRRMRLLRSEIAGAVQQDLVGAWRDEQGTEQNAVERPARVRARWRGLSPGHHESPRPEPRGSPGHRGDRHSGDDRRVGGTGVAGAAAPARSGRAGRFRRGRGGRPRIRGDFVEWSALRGRPGGLGAGDGGHGRVLHQRRRFRLHLSRLPPSSSGHVAVDGARRAGGTRARLAESGAGHRRRRRGRTECGRGEDGARRPADGGGSAARWAGRGDTPSRAVGVCRRRPRPARQVRDRR